MAPPPRTLTTVPSNCIKSLRLKVFLSRHEAGLRSRLTVIGYCFKNVHNDGIKPKKRKPSLTLFWYNVNMVRMFYADGAVYDNHWLTGEKG